MQLEPGPQSHDLLLTHRHEFRPVLSDVQLKAVLYREDGSQDVVERAWGKWWDNEVKKVTVPVQQYQKVTVMGTATGPYAETITDSDGKPQRDVRPAKQKIEGTWTISRDGK